MFLYFLFKVGLFFIRFLILILLGDIYGDLHLISYKFLLPSFINLMYIYRLILTILILLFSVGLVMIRKMSICTAPVLLIMINAYYGINVIDLNFTGFLLKLNFVDMKTSRM